MKFLARIKNGELDFGSQYNLERYKQFLKDSEEKIVKIENTDIISEEQ